MRHASSFTWLIGIVAFLSITYDSLAIGIPPVDLAVTQTAAPEAVLVGAMVTYTISVTYNDRTPAKDVVLTDTLPSDALYVSAISTQGTCTHAGGTVTCDIGVMTNNSSAVTATIVVTVPLSPGSISNTASVTSTTDDPNLINNAATQLTTVNLPTLTVNVSGDGTIQSSSDIIGIPSDITCIAGACSAGYPPGNTVNLTATPSWYSTMVWSGCDVTGNNTCRVLLNGDIAVNASFSPLYNVRLNYSAPLYSRITDAYAAIGLPGSSIIQAQAFSFLENLEFRSPVTVMLEGGMDSAFGPAPGYSTVGRVRISNGRVTFKNIVIR